MTYRSNPIYWTDFYKPGHAPMYPEGTQFVYSYFESRPGALYPETVAFGLQEVLSNIEGAIITQADIDAAEILIEAALGDKALFNREGWELILQNYGGRLPLRIKAVPEGTAVPVGNVLMTVENTDERLHWVTNYFESYLTHVWYASTVASKSYAIRKDLEGWAELTGANPAAIDFMLHDFGYRGAVNNAAAAIGGAGHLLSFRGTDTIVALEAATQIYDAPVAVGFSVLATEHSVMTAEGPGNDIRVLDRLLGMYTTGILSVVADSYDVYAFTDAVCDRKDVIMARDGKFVLRPDSITPDHPTPALLTLNLVGRLWNTFGGTVNEKGYKTLDPHIGVLWGDGIDQAGINEILDTLEAFGFASDNMVFGMGGGLLQKVNRDTQRSAFKCAVQVRNGVEYEISKNPLDKSKKSKAGRLKLVKVRGVNGEAWRTAVGAEADFEQQDDLLVTVFHNGHITRRYTFDEVRANLGALA